jgi:hypothetical protein
MNEGSKSGKQASGITLDSLLKLINTKGADKKTTVLDYVINLCFDKVYIYIYVLTVCVFHFLL